MSVNRSHLIELRNYTKKKMLENKVGKYAFAQRFHHQAINEAFTEGDLVAVFLTQRAT